MDHTARGLDDHVASPSATTSVDKDMEHHVSPLGDYVASSSGPHGTKRMRDYLRSARDSMNTAQVEINMDIDQERIHDGPCSNTLTNIEDRSLFELPGRRFFQRWNFGPPDCFCRNCGAILWFEERLLRYGKRSTRFRLCCLDGKVQLPYLKGVPVLLDYRFSNSSVCFNKLDELSYIIETTRTSPTESRTFKTRATVAAIFTNLGFSYECCEKCFSKLHVNADQNICGNCGIENPICISRMKIQVLVKDTSTEVYVTTFGKSAEKILGIMISALQQMIDNDKSNQTLEDLVKMRLSRTYIFHLLVTARNHRFALRNEFTATHVQEADNLDVMGLEESTS